MTMQQLSSIRSAIATSTVILVMVLGPSLSVGQQVVRDIDPVRELLETPERPIVMWYYYVPEHDGWSIFPPQRRPPAVCKHYDKNTDTMHIRHDRGVCDNLKFSNFGEVIELQPRK
jgi:hypothetical protein